MVDMYYGSDTNQTQYLFRVFDNLTANTNTQWRNDKITRAKTLVANVRSYESQAMPATAEAEVKKLIPE